MILFEPEPLRDGHELAPFDSGTDTLDEWLQRRARRNQASGASRTFVACSGYRVIAYYSLASKAIATMAATGRFRRNMPDPIPVVLLGRLAVDRNWQGKGLGRALIADAARRVVWSGDAIGIRGLVVHALSEEGKSFYEKVGFEPSPVEPMMLMITIEHLRGLITPR